MSGVNWDCMSSELLFRLAADLVLVIHLGFVAFVVLGLILILLGGALGWSWVRNFWLRIAHLVAIGIVVAQVWLGVLCPLTVLEQWLRARAGQVSYEGSFIAHWMGELLYWDWPGWVFGALYTGFGALVLASWFLVKPHKRGN